MGDQRPAEHLLRLVRRLLDRFGDAHPALLAGGRLLEAALAAAAGVDLRLDHPDRAVELTRRGLGLVGLQDDLAVRDRRAVVLQKLLGLVFVNVQLAAALLKVMGATHLVPEYGPERRVNPVLRRLASTRKAQSLLGFRAEVGLEQGLDRLVRWWQKNRPLEVTA